MESSGLLETCPLKAVDEILSTLCLKALTIAFNGRFELALENESLPDISESGPLVRDRVLQLYANTDATPFRPPCKPHHGKIIKVRAMIQQESLGHHFFLPLGQDNNGDYVNVGLFRDTSESTELAFKASPRYMVPCPSDYSTLMERTLMVVTSLPEEDAWSGRLLALIYTSFPAKVNDVVEITGVYYEDVTEVPEADMEYPYYLPSVHVLSIRHASQRVEALFTDWIKSRRIALAAISAALGIDHEASTMLLLSLISKVTSRTSGLLSSLLIGYFPLNIRLTGASSVTASTIVSLLRCIFPRSCVLQLNLKALEESLFVSRMNYETGELERGLLQVPTGTLVIIDETVLEAGKLSERATRSLQSLIEFVSHQRVTYEFGGYHTVGVNMNNPVVVLSQGKSILPVDNHIAVPTDIELSVPGVDAAIISNYISSCRCLEINISTETADEIHGLFMKERGREVENMHSTKPPSMDANELSAALNLSRLLAASFGSSEVTLVHFLEAQSLTRSNRCQ